MANQNLNLVLSHYGLHSDQNFVIEVRFHLFLWSNIPEINYLLRVSGPGATKASKQTYITNGHLSKVLF